MGGGGVPIFPAGSWPRSPSCCHPPSCPGARCLPLGLAPVGYSLPRGERSTGKGREPQGGWSSWTLLQPSVLAPRSSLAEPAGLPSAASWGGTPLPPPKSRGGSRSRSSRGRVGRRALSLTRLQNPPVPLEEALFCLGVAHLQQLMLRVPRCSRSFLLPRNHGAGRSPGRPPSLNS